jgi:hypothetical protein
MQSLAPDALPSETDHKTARGRPWADIVGLSLALALGGWVGLVANRPGESRAAPLVALILATVVVVLLARWASRRFRVAGALALAVGVGLVMVMSLPTLSEPTGRPLGYANANATLAGLGMLAALGAASGGRPAREWPASFPPVAVALGFAALLAAMVVVAGSAASLLSLATALALGGLAFWIGDGRVAVAGGAIVVGAVLAATAAIALGADPADIGTRSEVRGDLWAGAADIAQDHPWFGIGPGAFAEQNPVTDDLDLRWAHHGYLQSAAELGLLGLVLILGLVAWAYWRLWLAASTHQVGAVAVGAGAVTLVALHATVDYVAHFPAIVLTAAFLFGWGTQGNGA